MSTTVRQVIQDNCLPLDWILQSFHCGIKEEQAFALIHQSIICLEDCLTSGGLAKPTDLFISSDGVIHPKTFRHNNNNESIDSLKDIFWCIGSLVYNALDYGTQEDEELILSSELELIIEGLTNSSSDDEGIESDEWSSSKVLDSCAARITDRSITNIGQHYRNVCRALVAEALELSAFLKQVSIGNNELKKFRNDIEERDDIEIKVWAHLWMKVMQQLRLGVTLNAIDRSELEKKQQKEYELTPYEMLLDDINSKNYELKTVASLPPMVEKDRRTTIMEYIRSRPPLKPVSERQLSPLPTTEPSLHEKLMEGIKSPRLLRPTPPPLERNYGRSSLRLPRSTTFSIYTRSVVIESPSRVGSPSLHPNSAYPAFQRLSFKNLSLRLKPKSTQSATDVTDGPQTSAQDSQGLPFWKRWIRW